MCGQTLAGLCNILRVFSRGVLRGGASSTYFELCGFFSKAMNTGLLEYGVLGSHSVSGVLDYGVLRSWTRPGVPDYGVLAPSRAAGVADYPLK